MSSSTDTSALNILDMKIRKFSNDFFMVGGKPRSTTVEEEEDAQPLFTEGVEEDPRSETPHPSCKERANSVGEFTNIETNLAAEAGAEKEESIAVSPLELNVKSITYQKTFQWKIPEFLQHIKRSSGSNPKDSILLSPEFFIPDSKTAVAVKLYPTGADDDEGMYLSIYFRFTAKDQSVKLLRREVTFSVKQQNEDPESDSINYHMILDCIGKALSATVGSGCHKCFSVRDLQAREFLSDDTLYISVTIEEEIQS